MKKGSLIAMSLMMLLAAMVPVVRAAPSQPGGFKGFLAGCCFGLRTGADYNDLGTGNREFLPWFLVGCCLGVRTQQDYRDGKEFHWREVLRAIPYLGLVFAIWDGAEISSGKGRSYTSRPTVAFSTNPLRADPRHATVRMALAVHHLFS